MVIERNQGKTVRVMAINMPQIQPFWKFVPEFEKEYGIKVIVDEMPFDQLQERSLMECAQHVGNYDLISVDCMWVASFARPGFLEPLIPWLKNDAVCDPEFDLDDIVPRAAAGTGVLDDVLYNLPMGSSTCGESLRKDLFEQNGVALPATPDEWTWEYARMAAEKCNQPDKGYYGWATHARRGMEWGFTWWFYVYAFQKADRYNLDELFGPNWEVTLYHPDTVRSLEWFVGMKPFTPPGSENFGYDEMSTAYQQGRVAIGWNYGSWIWGHFENPDVSKVVGKSMHIPAGITGPYGKKYSHFGSWGLAMNKDSRNKEAAMLFYTWIFNKPNSKRAALVGGSTPRHSVYRDPEIQALQPWIKYVYDHQLHRTNPNIRPMIAEWTEIAETFGLWGNKCWIGEINADTAVKNMQKDIEQIMKDGGYYDPSIPKPVQYWRIPDYYDLNPSGWQ
jgi:multiple sugar transport system substrate-binding protein